MWEQPEGYDEEVPFGQKMWMVDDEEIPFLELRSMEFTPAPGRLTNMPLADDLLNPIEGPNPSGATFATRISRQGQGSPARGRRPPAGMTEQDRKVADNPLVIKLATEALAKKTKDLAGGWLTEAWVKQNGVGGFCDGLTLCHGLVEKFWDTLYPRIEDGDAEMRAAPLEFLVPGSKFPQEYSPRGQKKPYGYTDVQESRKLGYETDAQTDEVVALHQDCEESLVIEKLVEFPLKCLSRVFV